MATWIMHFRIAEGLLSHGFDDEPVSFLIGNVAPDSGIPNENGTEYDPPKSISHFHDDAGEISPERFYQQHLIGREHPPEARAFLVGYYVHLLTDVCFQRNIWRARRTTPLYAEALARDPSVGLIKRDWWGLDFLYLMRHPESMFFSHILPVRSVPNYLDIFQPASFTRQLENIQQFYSTEQPNIDRECIYLTMPEVDAFIGNTVAEVAQVLHKKNL